MSHTKDIIARLSPLLGGRGRPRPGETAALLNELKLSLGHDYHTDPLFRGRVQLAERLIDALGPHERREAITCMVGILPLVDELSSQWAPPPIIDRTVPPVSMSFTTTLGAVPDELVDQLYGYAERLTRERHARIESVCRQSLKDPEHRGVLIVRDPATGKEAITLDASVPWCTIHDYPNGKNGHAPKTTDATATAQREEPT